MKNQYRTNSDFLDGLVSYYGMQSPENRFEHNHLGQAFLEYEVDAFECERRRCGASETKYYKTADLELRGYDSLNDRGERANKVGSKKYYIIAPKSHLETPNEGEETLEGLLNGYKGHESDDCRRALLPFSEFVLFVDGVMYMPSSPVRLLKSNGWYAVNEDTYDHFKDKISLSVRKALKEGSGKYATEE